MNLRKSFRYVLLLSIVCLSASVAFAQEKQVRDSFCQNWGNHNGDKVSFNEVREMTLAASGNLTVDGRRNGGIRVKGSDRKDILVRACIQTWGVTEEEARGIAKDIQFETGSTVRATNSTEEGWSVSYEIHVPRATSLKLTAYNGGIGISGVEGNLDFETHNGSVSLLDVAGNVKGRTTNGSLSVKLSGNSWKGSGLDVQTTNGSVNLSLSDSYAARIETGTVNGGFSSDISTLDVERDERNRPRNKRVSADLNGGGALVRVITTNGGVRINSSK